MTSTVSNCQSEFQTQTLVGFSCSTSRTLLTVAKVIILGETPEVTARAISVADAGFLMTCSYARNYSSKKYNEKES